jgi:hypothetical protein
MNIVLRRAIAAIFAVPAVSFGATVVLNGGTINQCTMRKSVTLPNGDVRIDCAETPQTGAFVVNPPCLVDNKTVAGKPVIRVSCDVEEDIRRYTLVVGNADGSLRAYQQARLGRPDGIYSLTDAATQGGFYTFFSIWEGEGPAARKLIEPISIPILNNTATGCFLRPHLNRHPDFSQYAANLVAVTAECVPSSTSRIASLEVKQVGASTADKLSPVQLEGTAGSAVAASFLLDKLPKGSYEVKLLDSAGQPVSGIYPITVDPFDYNNVLNGPGGLATLFGAAGNSCFFQDNQLQSGDRAAFLCGAAPTPAPTAAPTPAPTATPAPPAPSQCQITPTSTSVLAGASATFNAVCSPQLAAGTVVTWRLTNAGGTEVNNATSATSYQSPTTLTAGTYTLRYNFGSAQANPATLTVSGSPTAPSPSPTTAPPTGQVGNLSCGLAIQDLFGSINIGLVSCTPSNPSVRTYSFLNRTTGTQFAAADTGSSVNGAVAKPVAGEYRITAIATPGFTTGSITCDFSINSSGTMTPGAGCVTPTPGPTAAPTPAPTLSPTPSCTLIVPATSQAGLTKFSASCLATAVAPTNPKWEITSTVTATNTQTVAAPTASPYTITLPATVVDGTYTVKFLADNSGAFVALATQAVTVAPTPSPAPAGQCSGIADSSEQQFFNEGVGVVFNPYLNSNGFKAYEFVINPITKTLNALFISLASPDNNAEPDLDVWVSSCPQEGGPSGTYAPGCRGTSSSGIGLAYTSYCKVAIGDKVVVNFKATKKVPANTQIKVKFDYQ